MLLTVDVGNTTIQCGLFEGEKLALQFRRSTNSKLSSDELGLFFRDVLALNNFDYKAVERIACCSVVPAINHSLSNCFRKYFFKEALFIQAGIKTGLKIKYANPREIGADRIAGAIGEHRTKIDPNKCKECGMCAKACPYGAIAHLVRPCKKACPVGAITYDDNGICVIDEGKCIQCGHCIHSCPFGAIGSKTYLVSIINEIRAGKEVIAMVLSVRSDPRLIWSASSMRSAQARK